MGAARWDSAGGTWECWETASVLEDVRYAEVDGTHVAFRVVGEPGGRDLVMVSGQFFAMEQLLEDRVTRRLIDGLAGIGRLVLFDKRGVGVSDPFVDWSRLPHRQWADDLVGVIEAAQLTQPTVVSWDPFGIARLAAADRPELVGSLVLLNPVQFASQLFPASAPQTEGYVTTAPAERLAFPSRIDDPDFRDWLERAGRAGASPSVAERLTAAILANEDELTPTGIRCPTLVLHRVDCMARVDHVREVAEARDVAELVQVEGADVLPISGDVDPLIAEISRFVTGAVYQPPPQRLVAAVLFTDLVASTDSAVGVGDQAWRSVLDTHDHAIRACVERCGGEIVKFTGDGVLALLPSTQAAVVAAHTIRHRLAELGLQIRAGIHVGDIDRRGGDVSGVAVNLAARIMDQAAPAEILVSDPVRRAMLGTSAGFERDRTIELKGIPDSWTLHRSTNPP